MLLHTFNPHPVLFQIGPLTLYWYGLIMVLAIIAGIVVVRKLAGKTGLAQPQAVYDLTFVVTIAALVGARLYAVLLFWPEYAGNPLEIFKVWHGGMAIHGALIGGTLALWWYCRRRRQPFLVWADVMAVALPLGQAIGRWGNYFNQELFGPPTNLPWGIFIAPENRPASLEQSAYFHPTFLYESLLNLSLFFVLLWYYQHQHKQQSPMTTTNDQTRRHGLRPLTGKILSLYLLGYGIIRLLMETLRLDETPLLLGLRWPILVSILLIIGGIALLASKKIPSPSMGEG